MEPELLPAFFIWLLPEINLQPPGNVFRISDY